MCTRDQGSYPEVIAFFLEEVKNATELSTKSFAARVLDYGDRRRDLVAAWWLSSIPLIGMFIFINEDLAGSSTAAIPVFLLGACDGGWKD